MPLTMEEKEYLKRYLEEDSRYGDPASLPLKRDHVMAAIHTEEDCILSGVEPAIYLFEIAGCSASLLGEGTSSSIKKGTAVMEVSGPAEGILRAERIVLNILSRMSGIATLAGRVQKEVEEVFPGVRVAGTRKTTPGFSMFEKRALIDGGALPHRSNLTELAMLKDNHLKALGGGPMAVTEGVKELRRLYGPYKPIEVEAESSDVALVALEAGADIIMLDNMGPEMCGETAAMLRERESELERSVTLEASGRIGPEDAVLYAPHVDVISMGCLTSDAHPISFRMDTI